MDPGNSTGWIFRDENGIITGGVVKENFIEIARLITQLKPDVLVYESFGLYPGMAKSLAHNEFYPCQVIGVILYIWEEYAEDRGCKLVKQAPSVKKYAGKLDDTFGELQQRLASQKIRMEEHIKDAYLHLKYYQLKYENKKEDI